MKKNRLDLDVMKSLLEQIYAETNQRQLISPDPLQFLHDYPNLPDREIVALIAALLAYGRVEQILKAVLAVLDRMQHRPLAYLQKKSTEQITRDMKTFRYRFTTGENLAVLLIQIQRAVHRYGTLHQLFADGITPDDRRQCHIIFPMIRFFENLLEKRSCGHLFPDPAKGSACKRLNLFLRWMVRNDSVDPGGWESVPPSMLIVPLDTHMHHIGKILGFTRRTQPDMKTALEITRGFRKIVPEDPVKYDFCLTRFGIRREMELTDLEEMVSRLHESNNH